MFNIIKYLVNVPQDESDVLCRSLRASDVPVSTADCRTCADPCDLGHETYPRRLNVDLSSNMLGSVKPYHRQVVISTGKSDWERDITDEEDSLAASLSQVMHGPSKIVPQISVSPPRLSSSPPKAKIFKQSPGLFSSTDSDRISVLNGSHRSLSHEDDHETVLVFPDYKCISEVSRSLQGALELWQSAVDPSGREGTDIEGNLKTWVIPYASVILLCSHRKRDNRCGITAPKLEHAFIKALESRGWDADTQLEHPLSFPLENSNATPEERENTIAQELQASMSSKRVLIVKVSHIGGHKYAGNVIIYTPSGSGIWYGRVTPHDVDSIVSNTIIDGLVLPPLLRGGVNLTRPNCTTLNDW